jgi:hypothetical protein
VSLLAKCVREKFQVSVCRRAKGSIEHLYLPVILGKGIDLEKVGLACRSRAAMEGCYLRILICPNCHETKRVRKT